MNWLIIIRKLKCTTKNVHNSDLEEKQFICSCNYHFDYPAKLRLKKIVLSVSNDDALMLKWTGAAPYGCDIPDRVKLFWGFGKVEECAPYDCDIADGTKLFFLQIWRIGDTIQCAQF